MTCDYPVSSFPDIGKFALGFYSLRAAQKLQDLVSRYEYGLD